MIDLKIFEAKAVLFALERDKSIFYLFINMF
jgi:hypothetical protein